MLLFYFPLRDPSGFVCVAGTIPVPFARSPWTTLGLHRLVLFKSLAHICFFSILYKTKLPFIVVFNKIDVEPHAFALEWMRDFETFQEALASHQSTTDDEGAPTYMNSLMNSMSLVLDEFYKHLKVGPHSFPFQLWSFTFLVSGRIQHDRRGCRRVLSSC